MLMQLCAGVHVHTPYADMAACSMCLQSCNKVRAHHALTSSAQILRQATLFSVLQIKATFSSVMKPQPGEIQELAPRWCQANQ